MVQWTKWSWHEWVTFFPIWDLAAVHSFHDSWCGPRVMPWAVEPSDARSWKEQKTTMKMLSSWSVTTAQGKIKWTIVLCMHGQVKYSGSNTKNLPIKDFSLLYSANFLSSLLFFGEIYTQCLSVVLLFFMQREYLPRRGTVWDWHRSLHTVSIWQTLLQGKPLLWVQGKGVLLAGLERVHSTETCPPVSRD